jgi:ABC-type ATPase involved in cell division/GNAT superfamily N-acetyltransferase
MPRVDLVVETPIGRSSRVKQLEAMFDVPSMKTARQTWTGEVDVDSRPWTIGLILGPSGSGKSTLLRHLFGAPATFRWTQPSVIDDFGKALTIETISRVCQAVGFNTIPAWMRPFRVLSNGERFRVELARRLLEAKSPIVVDEFTSVVDRQVAQIGAHAVQKYLRGADGAGRRFVAASCHYDIVDWLQPDWVLQPATMSLTWRDLQRRPAVECEVRRVPYDLWRLFAPFHYLTAELARAARCFALFVGGRPAVFAGVMNRPHARVDDIMGVSRLVTLPDFQGLGLAMALVDTLGAAYRAIGKRLHTYPAHPALTRAFDRSTVWRLEKRPGTFSARPGATSSTKGVGQSRPCAVFSYVGPAFTHVEALEVFGA